MSYQFMPGDNLVFQLEAGFGILRLLAVEAEADGNVVYHLAVLEDFFPDTDAAESFLAGGTPFRFQISHLALSGYAFEKTSAARLDNAPVTDKELEAVADWRARGGTPTDRSLASMLGLR